MRKIDWISSGVSLVFLLAAQSAFAQQPAADPESDQPDGGNEIVVTAQRREQTLQDVPLAVSVATEQMMVRQEAMSTQGLLRMFPNVSGAQITGSGANNYSIRGLSNAETAATFDSPVGTYIDGIYLARVNANNFALFDVERIEILRGPQGTLFGRNTTGGAVNVILKGPGDDLGASIEGSYGSYKQVMLRGSIDAPLAPGIRTRLAGYYMDEDGYAKNLTTGGTVNGHSGWGVRGATSIDLSPDVTWDVAVDYIHDENSNIPTVKVNGEWTSSSGLTALGSLVTGPKAYIPGNRVINKTLGITSKLSIDSAIGKISVISGYRDLITAFNLDYFNQPYAIGGYDSVQYSKHRQFTQEANIAGSAFGKLLDYTVGAYYFKEWNVSDFTTVFRLGSGAPFIDADRTLFNKGDSIALYGQFDLHVLPKLTLTAGARWSSDSKSIHYMNNGNPRASAAITDAIIIAAGIPLNQSASVVTPRFALTYKPNDDLMFFGSATKGFKSGGWNARSAAANQLGAFANESIWSFEGGMRSQLWDKKLTFNLTGFYGYTKNLQIATAVGTAVASAPVFPVGNFSDFRSYGLEAELTVKPVRSLSIFLNGGVNKTEYANPTTAVIAQQAACKAALAAGGTSTNCGNGIVRTDGNIADPLRAPEFTGTAGFTWEVPVTSDWNLVPTASGRYVSSFNANSAQLANSYDNGYFLLAGSVGLESVDGTKRLSVGCENCTDTNYLVSVIAGYYYYSPPRRWTVRASYKF